MSNDNASLGKASLWTSIAGVLVPGCLAVLVVVFVKSKDEQGLAFVICGILLTILESVALGCGIAARGTVPGKAGLIVSGIVLLAPITAGVLVFLPGGKPTPAQHELQTESR